MSGSTPPRTTPPPPKADPPPPTTTASDTLQKGALVGAILGGVVGGLTLLALLALLACLLVRHHRRHGAHVAKSATARDAGAGQNRALPPPQALPTYDARRPQAAAAQPQVMWHAMPSTLTCTFTSTSTFEPSCKHSRTLDEPDAKAQLVTALHNMATAAPVQLFARRYQLLDARVEGGQAVVCFARDSAGSMFQYAIKCAL